jgi:hypothetical protein
MIEGINVNQRVSFVCECDKTEPKTEFILKPLSGFEMMEIWSDGYAAEKFLKKSIVEIKGISDKDAFLDSMPTIVLGELLKKANELNGLSEQEAKN